jgi:hypothetical protein
MNGLSDAVASWIARGRVLHVKKEEREFWWELGGPENYRIPVIESRFSNTIAEGRQNVS